MIIVRAPLRISFVGGGTDLAAYYSKKPGSVISAAINKYVYVTLTRTPSKKVSVRYSIGELVDHPRELQHNRVRAMLLDLDITDSIEISSFSQIPGQTGLGSSSAFSVALVKGLHALTGTKLSARACAEEACRLEIDLLHEPIGKQDQYASALGGLNVMTFHKDESVDVEPLHLDYRRRLAFEDHLLLYFTGITREASSILSVQKKNTAAAAHRKTLEKMAASVPPFKKALEAGDLRTLARMLDSGWKAKKTLAPHITNPAIDDLYARALKAGAWGGKLLGAGGGGCLLFVIEPSKRAPVTKALDAGAKKHALENAGAIPFSFAHSGVEIIHQQ